MVWYGMVWYWSFAYSLEYYFVVWKWRMHPVLFFVSGLLSYGLTIWQTTVLGNDQSVIMRANRLPVTCLAVTGCSYSLPTTTASAGQTPAATTKSTSTDNENGFKKVQSVHYVFINNRNIIFWRGSMRYVECLQRVKFWISVAEIYAEWKLICGTWILLLQ